jgi:hypothetical protein
MLDVFTSVSPLILWRRRAGIVRSSSRCSHDETDSTEEALGERVVYSVSRLRRAGCTVESLGQLCGAEQCVLVDTAERTAGCEL